MSDATALRIGTRGSQLALRQTQLFVSRFLEVHPDWQVEVVRISTKGDRVQDRPLAEVGGKALFVEEIEHALRAGEIHVAVHSVKDIPSALPGDMAIVACLPRADVRDVLVSQVARRLDELAPGARVGTSSPRRACQLRALRSDLEIVDIRGNVDTRLAKLERGDFDAIVLAAAGLERLGLIARATQFMETTDMLPCAGQGAIGIETLAHSPHAAMVGRVNDVPTFTAVTAERAFAERVNGNCDTPLAAHAVVQGTTMQLTAMIGHADGRSVSGVLVGTSAVAHATGRTLAETLLAGGGRQLLGILA